MRRDQPADLAVELPTHYDLVLNMRTARALGLHGIGTTVDVVDNDATRGMVRQIRFLVTVEELPRRRKLVDFDFRTPPRSGDDVAMLTGVVIGVLLLIAAIRAMFGKRGNEGPGEPPAGKLSGSPPPPAAKRRPARRLVRRRRK